MLKDWGWRKDDSSRGRCSADIRGIDGSLGRKMPGDPLQFPLE